MPSDIKPTHKPIRDYYRKMEEYRAGDVTHEGAVSTAFQSLLDDALPTGWRLVPQEEYRLPGNGFVRPDATIRDDFGQRRGYWEAKDTKDDLDAEIAKKRAAGYPLTNTIFEDTRQAVLYQNRGEAMRIDLVDPRALAGLLNHFFSYAEPQIEDFDRAVEEFKGTVRDIADGLVGIIAAAYAEDRAFQVAFDGFLDLCKGSINPNISKAAVDEMLVQHLLTERLMRTVFDNPDFARRNIIAVEVEKVIDVLTSHAFSRADFLRSLDRFYVAIENSARGMTDFSDKQHFLNTVYERFFQGYAVKVADTHGIVYTPQPIVDFMCASVVDVLRDEFDRKLGDPDVFIIDPCTGTGSFIVNLMHRCPKPALPDLYGSQLFANEVMLLPYYIAALNIEHTYLELKGNYRAFEGLCFVDTLGLAEEDRGKKGDQIPLFDHMTEENDKRVQRQRKTPITVVIGNPPYNMGQVNENDNNKNRAYAVVDKRVRDTYAHASSATLKNKLYDPYVKFFRWATDRLGGRDGIVCFVSNNSFIDQVAFDGMRKHLAEDFTAIYHADLHGNVRKNPKLSGTTHNVFGIQVGVGITLAVRKGASRPARILYERVPEKWRKEEKYDWLARSCSVHGVSWRELHPDVQHTWLVAGDADEFAAFLPIGSKEAKAAGGLDAETVFKLYSLGVSTNRDMVVYDFDRATLVERVRTFADDYNAEVDRYRRSGRPADVDSFVRYEKIAWSEGLKLDLRRGTYAAYREESVRRALYRPFLAQYLFFDGVLNDRRGQFPGILPTLETETENRVICVSALANTKSFHCLATRVIPDLHLTGDSQCFPFYVYDEDGTNQRENITEWAARTFRARYGGAGISKWDIFHYVYAVLHHPGYRQKFADNLKRELPRIPFAPDFRAFAEAGEALARLHVGYEEVEPWPLAYVCAKDTPLSYRVEKMKLTKDRTAVVVNGSLTLAGVPEAAFGYRLGNRSALEWVIDQYRVTTDARSGIVSDPNRADDPKYIVNLVGRVVRVSVETVRIVDGLAAMSQMQVGDVGDPHGLTTSRRGSPRASP